MSRESVIEGFQEIFPKQISERLQDVSNFQEQLTFLPPQVEDFFRPPAMQQAQHSV